MEEASTDVRSERCLNASVGKGGEVNLNDQGLVRVVALDGSVWWVRPESADSVRAFSLTDIAWHEPLGVDGKPVPPAAKAPPAKVKR
jgi:hypothetical protein